MCSGKKITGAVIAVIFLFSATAFGMDMPSNAELMSELKAMREMIISQDARIAVLENRVVQQEQLNIQQQVSMDVRTAAIERLRGEKEPFGGLEIGAASTIVGQGTTDANNAGDQQHKSRFDGSYSVDLTLEKQFGDYGVAFVHLEAGQGAGLTDKLGVFSNVNYDATAGDNRAEFIEVWYQQYLFDRQVMLTAGKLDGTYFIDSNAYANDECTQFLGNIFRNAPTIEFPRNTFGGRMFFTSEFLMKCIEAETVYMDAKGQDWNDIFSKGFVGAQLNFMPARAFGYDEDVWGGNYRAYFWFNGRDHVKIGDSEKAKQENYGYGFSCDQMLTDAFGWFGRFGWANPEVYSGEDNLGTEYTWSTGLEMKGGFWSRKEDVVAIAVGQVIPGGEYKDASAFGRRGNETHFETYYSCKLNDHLTLSPDVQVIWDPDGQTEGQDAIFVYGVRGQIDL